MMAWGFQTPGHQQDSQAVLMHQDSNKVSRFNPLPRTQTGFPLSRNHLEFVFTAWIPTQPQNKHAVHTSQPPLNVLQNNPSPKHTYLQSLARYQPNSSAQFSRRVSQAVPGSRLEGGLWLRSVAQHPSRPCSNLIAVHRAPYLSNPSVSAHVALSSTLPSIVLPISSGTCAAKIINNPWR